MGGDRLRGNGAWASCGGAGGLLGRWVGVLLVLVPLIVGTGSAEAASARAVTGGQFHSCAVTTGGGVRCWGDNSSGQLGDGTTSTRATPVDVVGLTGGVVAVVAGARHTCALTSDGGVKCWGYNSSGQLGNGTTTDAPTPVNVTGLTSGVMAIGTGRHHTCAVTAAGGVKCWGYNVYGQLGDGTTTDAPTPVDVSGLASGVMAIAPRGYHTCVLTSAGGVKCWGYNGYGQLGDGTTTNRSAPGDVTGMTSGVAAVTGGTYSMCALKTSGGVECWGSNNDGELGDGTTTDRSTPVAVSGLTSGVVAVGAGYSHACAVLGTGGLECWGYNGSGQLGDGTTTNRSTPVAVTGLASGVAAVGAGDSHTCAVLGTGALQCWGYNGEGELGDGTTTDRLAPTGVSGLTGGEGAAPAGAQQVAAGQAHSCAVTLGGGVKCWGYNYYGQLGDGTTRSRITPVDVWGLTSGVAAVVAGMYHSCALTMSGGVKCWGDNAYGQLGDGTTTAHATPADVSGLTSGVVAVTTGQSHTCALTSGGGVKCWGANVYGQLGDGSTTNRPSPVDVSGLVSGMAMVSAGGFHTCAVTTAAGAKCWGLNSDGQLGDNSTTSRSASDWVSGLTNGVAAISGGQYSTCVLLSTGGVKCWGYNAYGQVGDGTTTTRLTPVDVSGLSSGVSVVRLGRYHACALTTGGGAKCWGHNTYGEVGDGTMTNQLTPVAVSGLTAGVTGLAGGYFDTCAVTARGGVQCWGYNAYGELGDGTATNRTTPVWVTGLMAGVGILEASQIFSCRLTTAGGVQCWGDNTVGQLGDGTTTDHRTPVDVSGLTSGVVSVATGGSYACALTSGGGVKCWGYNWYGQLGDGTTADRRTPVDVVGRTSGTVAIAAGRASTCALTAAGGVQCWGASDYGQLGDGTTTSRSTPGWVSGLSTGVTAMTVSIGWHACALTVSGGVKCWGRNSWGNLGDGTTTNRATPVDVSGLTSGVAAVVSGGTFTCALTTGGGVKCWGQNSSGQLGDGTTTYRHTPVDVIGMTSGVVAVAAGSGHTCALTSAGGVKCWGYNAFGQLGDGTTTMRLTPVDVPGLTSGAAMVTAGDFDSCAVTVLGGIKCWGRNSSGQLGDGTLTDRWTPMTVRPSELWRDFDGDVQADVAVYRPASGTWFWLESSAGNTAYNYLGWGFQVHGDVPVVGDFDGDGLVDPTVYRPSAGTWFILYSIDNYTTWNWFGWGSSTDTLVPGDYDGDGKTDAAVHRASIGTFYVRPSSGATPWSVNFGLATDMPVPADYDGDGTTDIAVYRPSSGTWFVLTSSSGFTSTWYRGWGIDALGDVPAPGDYDGDGKTDVCVFRPSVGTWFILESHANYTTWKNVGWGTTGDVAVPSDYDGDGTTDIAVYRPATGTWYIRPSSGATQWSVVFGQSGDVPLLKIR